MTFKLVLGVYVCFSKEKEKTEDTLGLKNLTTLGSLTAKVGKGRALREEHEKHQAQLGTIIKHS